MAAICVIVPIYNVEPYLRMCIESILNQNFQDFELLLIDDGSTDGSGDICDQYAQHHKNVRVIHRKHEGVSSTRNIGLDESRGEYIAFIDSDDYVDGRYLETLYRAIETYDADMVLGDSITVCEGRRIRTKQTGEQNGCEILSKAEAYRRMFVCDHSSVTLWAKLYRRRLFRTVRFPTGELYEDTKILGQIVEGCHVIACTRYAGYYYRRRKGSILHGEMSPERYIAVRNAQDLWDFVKERYPEIEEAARVFYVNNLIQLINLMVLDPEGNYKSECKRLCDEVTRESIFFVFSRYTNLEEKCAAIILRFGIPCYGLAWQIYLRLTGKGGQVTM